MENTTVLQWVMITATMGLAAFLAKEVYRLNGDHKGLQRDVTAQGAEAQRNFSRIETWLRDISVKLDRLDERLGEQQR